MKHRRIIKYIAKGLIRYSDAHGVTWKFTVLTEFTGPKELKII